MFQVALVAQCEEKWFPNVALSITLVSDLGSWRIDHPVEFIRITPFYGSQSVLFIVLLDYTVSRIQG